MKIPSCNHSDFQPDCPSCKDARASLSPEESALLDKVGLTEKTRTQEERLRIRVGQLEAVLGFVTEELDDALTHIADQAGEVTEGVKEGQYAVSQARLLLEGRALPTGFPKPREFVDLLSEVERMLAPCQTKEFESVEDGPVQELGKHIGYGAMMISASKVWRDHLVATGAPPGGQFICGPCDVTVGQLLANIRGLLARTRG
jgi:hypothetical protein